MLCSKRTRRNELHLEATYQPGNELAPEYRGLYGKQSMEEKRGEMRAARTAMMGQIGAQSVRPSLFCWCPLRAWWTTRKNARFGS